MFRKIAPIGRASLEGLTHSSSRRTALVLGAMLGLSFAAIALESTRRAGVGNLAVHERQPPAPRGGGVLLSADGELRLDGEIAPAGTLLPNGGRLDAVRGDALIQFDQTPLALLREGTSMVFDRGGEEATLYHGRAQFEAADEHIEPRPIRVRAGQVEIDLHGMSFTVERTRTDDRVRVTVREGGAHVIAIDGQRSLKTGEETTVVRGRVGSVRAVGDRRQREDRAEAPRLDGLKKRAARLLDDWAP